MRSHDCPRQLSYMGSINSSSNGDQKHVSCDNLAFRSPCPPVHLRDVQDKVGKLRPIPAPAQHQLSILLLMVVVVFIVIVVITNNIVTSIIIITIIRAAATQGAWLARWRDLAQAAGYFKIAHRYCSWKIGGSAAADSR